jgi:hypothetical protein
LAFDQEKYTETLGCGQEFMVFASKSSSDTLCAPYSHEYCEDDIDEDDPFYNTLDCSYESVGAHISTADRGWMLFPDLQESDEYPDDALNNCQAAEAGACGFPRVACWILEDHPGPIEVGDCIPSQPGVNDAAKTPINMRVDDVVRIPLWAQECGEGDPEPGACSEGTGTTIYRIAGFGCIQVVGWEQNARIDTCGGSPGHRNLNLVRAIKICEDTNPDLYPLCSSSTGTTSGVPPEEWESRSVSLIQWPPSSP